MTSGWRPKWVRNNNWTVVNERARLAQHGIYIGAYAHRASDTPPSFMSIGTSAPPPKPASRFAPPPTDDDRQRIIQLAQHNQFERDNRYNTATMARVKREFMGFRDAWISDRHRRWGKDAPMVDIDFLVIDYDRCQVRALVEYKCGVRDDGIATAPPDFARANYQTLINMADRLSVPMFVVYYDRARITFTVYPANRWAQHLTTTPKIFSEVEWVERIYALSGRILPDNLRAVLSNSK